MQKVSEKYKNLLNTSLSLSPKSKIVVDGVEYVGDVIKTSPKISHSNTSFIGGFPAKTISFDIYNLNNDLDFENKEITLFKGVVIDGEIEWVQQGIFIPQPKDIKNNISTKVMSISKAQDKTQLFDDKYKSELDWTEEQTHTGLEIVQEICTKKGITLETTNFAWSNYAFKQPNFNENTSNREVISRLAQIGGEMAFLSSNGGLVIKGQYATGDEVTTTRYEKLTKENPITINTIVLGKEGVEDNVIYPETIDGDRVEFKIEDNPFVDLYREEMISIVASYVIGKSYTPFELTNFVDGFIYELNDVVSVVDKNGNTFDAVILDYSTASRIKANLKAPTQDSNKTDYNLAKSKLNAINQVKLEVDHNKQEINMVASETAMNSEAISALQINTDSISASVKKVEDNTTEALASVNTDISTLTTRIDATMTAEDVNIAIKSELENGVSKVETTTGFKFDESGLTISKTGSEMTTNIDEDGMTITRDNEEVLIANNEGVQAYNLHANTYLIIGETSRFEDYEKDGETRTGCFWIGGAN